MKNLLSLLFFLFVGAVTVFAQYLNLDDAQIQRVSASSLNLRSEPSRTGKVVASIPNNATIYTISNPLDETEIIDGKSGSWLNAYYEGKHGYIFSAYVSEETNYERSEAVLKNIFYVLGNARPLMDKPQLQGAMELTSLDEGTAVYMLELKKMIEVTKAEDSDWIKVRYKNEVGYMRSDFLMDKEMYSLYLEALESGE